MLRDMKNSVTLPSSAPERREARQGRGVPVPERCGSQPIHERLRRAKSELSQEIFDALHHYQPPEAWTATAQDEIKSSTEYPIL